jgi:hypothetical protein
VINLLRLIIKAGELIKSDDLQRMACSGIFNLKYYQGVSDELGGRQAFYTELARVIALA